MSPYRPARRLRSATSALDAVVLVVSILAVVALPLAVVALLAGRHERRVEADLAQQLGEGLQRVEAVRGLGLESRGRAQVRGNGTLALTDDALLFQQWLPGREVRIALTDVTHVGTTRWWLGKTVGRRLLCVRWRTAQGDGDGMAWEVRDLEAWLAALGGER
ncbi:MAG TPA: hypothetical protein VGW75_13065 [Solirubrobacteraceae bacterium]|nr:hypothetical protein [Solirubrobacteraceae bacterium]